MKSYKELRQEFLDMMTSLDASKEMEDGRERLLKSIEIYKNLLETIPRHQQSWLMAINTCENELACINKRIQANIKTEETK